MTSLSPEEYLDHSGDSLRRAIQNLWKLDENTRLLPHRDFTPITSQSLPSLNPDLDESDLFQNLHTALESQADPDAIDPFLSDVCDCECGRFAALWIHHKTSHLEDTSEESLFQLIKHIWTRDDSIPFLNLFSSPITATLFNSNQNDFSSMRIQEPCPPPAQQFAYARFQRRNITIALGPSPQFILLMYTIIFLMGSSNLKVTLGPCSVRLYVTTEEVEEDDCFSNGIVRTSVELLAVDARKVLQDDRRIANENEIEYEQPFSRVFEDEDEIDQNDTDDEDDEIEYNTNEQSSAWGGRIDWFNNNHEDGDGNEEDDCEEQENEYSSYQQPAKPLSWADIAATGDDSQYQHSSNYENTSYEQNEDEQDEGCSNYNEPSISVEDAVSNAGSSLRKAVDYLWQLDINRLTPGKDYILNPQSKSCSHSDDAASSHLFVKLSDSVWNRPTFASFKRLLDNYDAETGTPERVSDEEREEEERFLESISSMPCIQFAHAWLFENSYIEAESTEDFMELLRDLWFKLYRRDASRDSSGFEHVFCGEIDDGKVKGMHNFVQIYLEEQRGNFDYKGYLDVYGRESGSAPPISQQLLLIRFEWYGYLKSVSSVFIGTSPEFELALYTMYFLSKQGGSKSKAGPYKISVKAHDFDGMLGSSYPDLLAVDLEKLASETPSTMIRHSQFD